MRHSPPREPGGSGVARQPGAESSGEEPYHVLDQAIGSRFDCGCEDARHFEMRTSGSDIIGINSVNDN